MTDLERIEIEGFKGLESISFEPSRVNLITGRNNTGKTSLLEAIALLFNPKDIRRFGRDVDRIIHVDHKEGNVRGITPDTEIDFCIRSPQREDVGQLFIYVYSEILLRHSMFSGYEIDSEEEHLQTLYSVIQRAFQDAISENHIANLGEEFVEIVINDESYPFYSFGKNASEIQSILYKAIWEDLDDDSPDIISNLFKQRQATLYGIDANGDEETNKYEYIDTPTIQGRSGYLEEPESTNVIQFIESIILVEDLEKGDEEKDAIKIDDIGDYIKQKELVDDIKTFDTDYLVFEKEDGEKYSIPYDFMGDGFKAIVGLLWELLDEDNENNIVLIEEPENHMHPGYIREVVYFLIELAKDEGVQLFITTHSSDFINSFFTENLTEEEEEFLKKEFSLIRMEEDGAVIENYETAEDDLKNLHLDLRGI